MSIISSGAGSGWMEGMTPSRKLIREVVKSEFLDGNEIILNYMPSSEILKWMDESLSNYFITPNKIRFRYGGPPMPDSIFREKPESDYRIDGQKLIFENEKDMTLFIIKFGDKQHD